MVFQVLMDESLTRQVGNDSPELTALSRQTDPNIDNPLNSKKNLFLCGLFKALHDADIAYCVSRNAAETFTNTGSDLDILASPVAEKQVEDLCILVAEQSGYRLALKARFTNVCLLFWAAPAEFVRVDIEGDLRWRFFPVVSAAKVLKERKLESQFFVPSAVGESLVLASNIACANRLSDRYRTRMEALWETIGSAEAAGLSKDEKEIISMARNGRCVQLRRFLIQRTLQSPLKWPAVIATFFDDLSRLTGRLLAPPGCRVRLQGPAWIELQKLEAHLALAFPSTKNYQITGKGSNLNKFKSLFKGGLVMEQFSKTTKPDPVRTRFSDLCAGSPSRRVTAFRPTSAMSFLLDEDSGWMTEVSDREDPELSLASFIGESMARNLARRETRHEKGAFIVLVGLDGAGKTSFARNLCNALAADPAVRKTRYHHWIPSLRNRQYPWPATSETPRKKPAHGCLNYLLSMVRLTKNLLQAGWVYQLGIRRWVKRGDYVVVDRFIYNYWLDPVSLRYSGPDWLLRLAAKIMPKPDIVFSLETDADTLRSRKKELTYDEIAEQSVSLQSLPLGKVRKVVIDAGLSQEAMVTNGLRELKIR
jgi:hypothetical protein